MGRIMVKFIKPKGNPKKKQPYLNKNLKITRYFLNFYSSNFAFSLNSVKKLSSNSGFKNEVRINEILRNYYYE